MEILLKYTLKSIVEKKFRAFLIIFAIALSGGLFLGSTRLSDNIGDMYLEQIKETYGDIDLMVYPNEHAKTSFINMNISDKMRDQLQVEVPYLQASGTYKKGGRSKACNVQISGYRLEEYRQINKLEIIEGSTEDFQGNDIILSQKGAQELGVSVGETFDMTIGIGKRKVKLIALAGTEGMFSKEQNGLKGIMPFETISRFNRTNGHPSTVYIKAKEGVDIKVLQQELADINSTYKVEEMIDGETIKQQLSMITVPFLLMTCIVVFMSAFIIFSCFKVIMLEKLPVVGTFRSVGADKKMMNKVLLLEAVLYGAIGGAFACVIGIGCLYGLESMMASAFMGGEGTIGLDIPVGSYLMTFLMGIGMAVLSTLVPIMSVSKISLKDIILNNRPQKKSNRLKNCIIGIILIIVGFALAMYIKGDIAMITSLLAFFIVIIGVIKVLPLFVLNISKLFGLIFKVIFGNIGELAAKNIKKNKSMLNSITLITIGMSILLTISTMTKNMSTTVFEVYGDFKCEIMGSVDDCNNQRLKMLRRIKGVDNVVECIEEDRKVKEFGDHTVFAEAISAVKLLPDIQFHIQGNEEELLKKLQTGRYVILDKFLKNRYKVDIGESLTLDFNGIPRKYEIIGFIDTMWNNGQMGLFPIKYYREDSKINTYNWFYMSVKPGVQEETVIEDIEDKMQGKGTYIQAVKQAALENAQGNSQMMSMISVFAILAMVIGIVGVLNNLMISFIERRQNIAMLRSIGMSKLQVLKMIFIEGLGSGLIGACGGIGASILSCKIFEYILSAMALELPMHILPELFISYLIGGMLITIIGSIIPARGSSKLNLIEAIKYE